MNTNPIYAKVMQQFFGLLALMLTAILCFILMDFYYIVKAEKPESALIDAGTNAEGLHKSPAMLKGRKLFLDNCAACHAANLDKDMTGPALSGVLTRWNNDTSSIYAFIRNSSALIESGHPYAKALQQKWKIDMAKFPSLTDEELSNLLQFISQ